jgi:hypothetical protein
MWSFTNSCVDVMPSLDSCGALSYVAWLLGLRFLGYNCCLIDWDLQYVFSLYLDYFMFSSSIMYLVMWGLPTQSAVRWL